MKIHIISADGRQQIDPTIRGLVLDRLPRAESAAHADAVVVPISAIPDFTFNEALRGVKKPIIIVDLMEYYGRADTESTHLFGVENSASRKFNATGEWLKFHEWAAEKRPVLYFKRELLLADASDTVMPIEWPCSPPSLGIDSRESFDKRPFDVFYSWGFSNPMRPRLASDIFGLMADGGVEVISSWDHIDARVSAGGSKWISIHTPHTHRIHIGEVMRRQRQAKMSVSMPGAGVKCFRSAEAACDAIPVMPYDDMAWSFPWIDRKNCIRISPVEMGKQIKHALNLDNLYDIYVASQANADRYRPERYASEHIAPAIQRVL